MHERNRQLETPDIETSSRDYATRFEGSVGRYFLDVQASTVSELIDLPSSAKILDVGGGHSQLATPLVEKGFAVTVAGSDMRCRERLDEQISQPFNFVCCNLLDLPFEDQSFDVVLAFRLLTHLEQWQIAIGELCRVAKTSVIVDYPDKRSVNFCSDMLFSLKKKYEGNTRTFRCFSRQEIMAEFKSFGFDRPVRKPQFFFPMVVHRMMRSRAISQMMESASGCVGLQRMFGSPVVLRVERRN